VLGSFTDCRNRWSGGAIATRSLPFTFSSAATFESRGFQSLETYNAMNRRKFVLLGCAVACVFANSAADARRVAEEIAKKAYWNSSYFGGTYADLKHTKLW